MKHQTIFLILSCIILSSCTATKLLTSNVQPTEVTNLKLLEPYSYISMIKKGNRGQLDDSISSISKQLNINVLKSFNGQIPITGDIILIDSTINKDLEKECENLILTAERNKNISNLKITPTLDKILEANDTRFGLIIICTGFTRLKGNYGKEIAKGAALGILTLGMYYQIPVKAYSTIYAMIVDSKEDNVAFYRKSFKQDLEPLDQEVLTNQYKKIFEGYFWTTK
ncbi:MAG TPA: hypothetical protein PLX53_00875 [Tenuifilaceae bacterium]|nr:hypothetical protein [Tenuifilaceae bacterium]HPM91102.1 hypothetical protein [Tenuifilaceae bacterium]